MSLNEIIAGLRFEAMREQAMALLDPQADHNARARLFDEAADMLREKSKEAED